MQVHHDPRVQTLRQHGEDAPQRGGRAVVDHSEVRQHVREREHEVPRGQTLSVYEILEQSYPYFLSRSVRTVIM